MAGIPAQQMLNTLAARLLAGEAPDDDFVNDAWGAVEELHGPRLQARANRYYFRTTTAEAVAAETVQRWAESLRTDGPARLALSRRQEYPSLSVWVENECRQIYRRERREEERLDQLRQRTHDADDMTPEEKFDQGAILFCAVYELPVPLRQVMLAWLNWDVNLDRPDTNYKVAKLVAEYLGLEVTEVYELVNKAKAILIERARQFEELGQLETAEALLNLTLDKPERPGFASPFFRSPTPLAAYAMRLVELSSAVGLRPLLRVLVQADLLGDQEAGRRFMNLILNSPELEQASSQVRADCLVLSAIYLDHSSARSEAAGDLRQAVLLLSSGLALLDKLLGQWSDPVAGELELGARWAWAILQKGILKRRIFQVRRLLDQAYVGPELNEAAALFTEVSLIAGREDHRVSALHQLANVAALNRHFDDGENKISLCLKRWDVMIDREPENAGEYLMRKAYEHRALAKIFCQRAASSGDVQAGTAWAEKALDEFDLAGSLSARQANYRILDEIDRERKELKNLAASRGYRLSEE